MSTPPSMKRGSSRLSRSSKQSSASSAAADNSVTELATQLNGAELKDVDDGEVDGLAPTPPDSDELALDLAQADPESEQGKLRVLLGILRKTLNVKDLASVRISLPAHMMEPIGNLEHWTYIDRPDAFAAIGASDEEDERFLAVLRWIFTKDLRSIKHPIAKPFNSILGEHFHAYFDVPALALDPKTRQPTPTHHLDAEPTKEVLANAGRGANSSTGDAALRGSPSVTAFCARALPHSSNCVSSGGSSIRSAKSTKSTDSPLSSTPATPSGKETARVVFINEQTSHHPPISHFTLEARGPQGRVICRGADQISAKFTGANVKIAPGPHNLGLFVELPDRGGEEYRITHPTGAVAGLLRGAPYATICDQTFVTCALPSDKTDSVAKEGGKKRLRAIIVYHEESWLSKPRFAVSGIVYRSSPDEAASEREFATGLTKDDRRYAKVRQVPKERVVAHLEGNWRGEIRWKKVGESTWTPLIDLLPLHVFPKTVAPLEEQHELETRRVWQPVCEALYKKDFGTASREKQRIEQEQRDKAEERKKKGETYRPVFFEAEPDDLADWDGRPKLTEAGRAAVERDFKVQYSTPDVAAAT
ncbi:hypothetical protein JCM5296_006274 [Sporobolomyces johnsonii]